MYQPYVKHMGSVQRPRKIHKLHKWKMQNTCWHISNPHVHFGYGLMVLNFEGYSETCWRDSNRNDWDASQEALRLKQTNNIDNKKAVSSSVQWSRSWKSSKVEQESEAYTPCSILMKSQFNRILCEYQPSYPTLKDYSHTVWNHNRKTQLAHLLWPSAPSGGPLSEFCRCWASKFMPFWLLAGCLLIPQGPIQHHLLWEAFLHLSRWVGHSSIGTLSASLSLTQHLLLDQSTFVFPIE